MPRASVQPQGSGWIALGPGNIGGRTRSFIINPQDPNTMYAGEVTGGVWKSTDGGKTWNNLTDGLPNMNIGALALDPNNSGTIYAGTGEVFDNRAGIGIFQSTDGGSSWSQLPSTAPAAAGRNFLYINRIVVSPNNSQQIYVATSLGIFSTNDGGMTWQQAPIAAKWYGCQDLLIRTDMATDYLFAACSGQTSNDTFAVWRNVDAAGAGVWTQVFTTANMGRTVIAVAPSQQSTIYAAAAGDPAIPRDGMGLAGVFRSDSNGDPGTWQTQVSGSDPNYFNTLLFANVSSTSGQYCNGGAKGTDVSTWGKMIAVDPLDPNRVWVGGVDLFRSDDGGQNWGVASLWSLSSPSYSHADRHLFVFHPAYDGTANQTAFQASDGGIYRTDNARAAVSTGPRAGCPADYQKNNAVTWSKVDNSVVGTQFYHGAAYPGGGTYFGGAQDNGVSRGSDQSGSNQWIQLRGGDGGSAAIDPADANRLFTTDQRLSFVRSLDGVRFASAISGITETSASFPFEPYFAMDPNEGRRLFLGGTAYLWRSVDGAMSWQAAAPVENGSYVSAVTVSPFDSNTVLFGTARGLIYSSSSALSSDGSTAWASSQPRKGVVASIAFDPANPGLVYATYSSLKSNPSDAHVYQSSDGGQTWQPSDGSPSSAVPDIGVWRLLVDPRDSTTLYLGTDLGLLISHDSGNTWGQDTGLPNVYIEDLGFDSVSAGSWLFAYTYGRGMFKAPLPGAPGSCSYVVNPTSVTADHFGGVFPINVSTSAGCMWVALPGTSPAIFGFQSPASGNGNGAAYLAIPPNIDTGPGTDTVSVAGTAIPVSRGGQSFQNIVNDHADTAAAITVPSLIRTDTRLLTSDPGDPVHSCTGSADYKTGWWKVTPPASGVLSLLVRGDRLDVLGDFGIVATAYAQNAPSVELACATVPKNNNARTTTSIKFKVTAGTTYLIEISATGNAAQDGGNATLVLTPGSPDVAVTVAPQTTSLGGGGSQQFSAQVTNAANAAIRWSISPPIGLMSVTGLYTAPASVAAPLTVTVTATSFADPTKQSSATIVLNSP